MRKFYVGNFDFEHRLASDLRGELPEAVRRINRELAACWVAVADEGDTIWSPDAIEDGFFERLADEGLPKVEPISQEDQIGDAVEVCPWGWTQALRDWGEQHGWWCPAPDQALVKAANSRMYSTRIERALGIDVPRCAVVESLDDLHKTLRDLPNGAARWVLKADFSMSARERLIGSGGTLTDAENNWVRNRLDGGGVLFFEPWVDRVEEAGLQFTIPASGPPVLEGLTSLLTDEQGHYRGSRFSLDVDAELRWMPAIEAGMHVARDLKDRGYFGPLGIDAIRYRDAEGAVRMRSIQDINARHTMGRMALGFRRLLEAGECASWLHVRSSADPSDSPVGWCERLTEKLPASARVIRTSPLSVAGESTRHGTLIVIAGSADELTEAETLILQE